MIGPALLLLVAACGDQESLPAPVVVRAPDDSGLFVEMRDGSGLDAAMQAAGAVARLQWREPDGPWHTVVGPSGEALAQGARYWLPADRFAGASLADLDLRLRAGEEVSPLVTPDATVLALDLDLGPQPLVADDAWAGAVVPFLGDLVGGSGALAIQVEVAQPEARVSGWLDLESCTEGDALLDCVSEDERTLALPDLDQPVTLPVWTLGHGAPATISLRAELWADAIGPEGRPTRGLVALDVPLEPVTSVGRRLAWGDLHTHSNLSVDGCEDPDADCGPRGDSAGLDLYANAVANGLDFAAITEHAEWGSLDPDGAGEAAEVDIWAEQLRLAAEADGPDLVALVGYEWSNSRAQPAPEDADAFFAAPYEGGHKTVVFQGLDIEEDFRVGANLESGAATRGEAVFFAGDNPQTDQPAELYALLDAAAATHGPNPALSFFHHAAHAQPQGADFAHPDSGIDQRYERLVEVYSEVGASECLDPDAEDCGWQLPADGVYLPRGSVQAALSAGWRLGFTAGTDCHDGRPGSLGDGPSSRAEGDGATEQLTGGGLTGAWIDGELDRDSVFDALYARATLATSGPRPDGRTLAVDAQGRPWLPGSVLPADAGPVRVLANLQAEGYTTERISLVRADGEIVATRNGPVFDVTTELSPADALYLRAVLTDSGTAQEHRVWVSPFFTESTP